MSGSAAGPDARSSRGPGLETRQRSEAPDARRPALSIVVVPSEGDAAWTRNVLHTWSATFQLEVRPSDYEVVVGDEAPEGGSDGSRATHAGLAIGEPRVVTPRVIRYALDAFAVDRDAVVTVPGYELGEGHRVRLDGRDPGYRLFESARSGGAGGRNLLRDPARSGCVFTSKERLAELSGTDAPIGREWSAAGPDLCRQLVTMPDSRWFLLAGEGAFRPPRPPDGSGSRGGDEGGLSSREAERSHVEPVLLGAMPGPALPFVQVSARLATRGVRSIRPD